VDALLVIAANDRQIRFLMRKDIFAKPMIHSFARMLGVIAIPAANRPHEMLGALRAASEAVNKGELVCVFAEGQISRTGEMLPFRRGFSRIMEGVNAPIIPVRLDGVWGSIFSFAEGKLIWKWPRQIPYRVTVIFGAPMAARSTASDVQRAVEGLKAR
jgi:acyl-[acyl-carrier-protein]-phospholipid O-acyltransferase/long-chain-fatty-acid--[acyl-carrier-protein] ligase